MPQPSPSWQTVRVYGTWRDTEDGTLVPGTYTATIPVRLVSAVDDSIFPPGVAAEGTLSTSPVDTDPADDFPDGPSLDIQVPATDDPDVAGDPWSLNLIVTFTDGGRETYALAVRLADAENGIDLVNIAPQESVPGTAFGGDFATTYPTVDGGTL